MVHEQNNRLVGGAANVAVRTHTSSLSCGGGAGGGVRTQAAHPSKIRWFASMLTCAVFFFDAACGVHLR